MTNPHVTAVIQARSLSSRLPSKVLRPLAGRSVLSWVVRAASESVALDSVVVATSDRPEDDELAAHARELGVIVVRGDEDDVLSRFLQVSKEHPTEIMVRLTADCPMLDPEVITHVVGAFTAANAAHPSSVEYLSTVVHRCLPHGLDVEAFSVDALERADALATEHHRAHVTSVMYTHPDLFRVSGLTYAPDISDLRITLDTPDDAQMLEALVEITGDRITPWRELASILRAHPEIVALNADTQQKAITEG